MENEEKIVNEQEQEMPEVLPEKEGYQPRPAWQVWAARLGLVVFIAFLLIYYLVYFRGGR